MYFKRLIFNSRAHSKTKPNSQTSVGHDAQGLALIVNVERVGQLVLLPERRALVAFLVTLHQRRLRQVAGARQVQASSVRENGFLRLVSLNMLNDCEHMYSRLPLKYAN